MGYELYMIVVDANIAQPNWRYCSIISHVDLCKYGPGKLIDYRQREMDKYLETIDKPELTRLVREKNEITKRLYNREGDYLTYNPVDVEDLAEIRGELHKYPYMYFTNQNEGDYIDPYGDPLVLLNPRSAMIAMQKDIVDEPYRRTQLAINMLAPFFGGDWTHSNIKVIMWGH